MQELLQARRGGIRVVKGNVGNAGTLYKRAEDKFGVRSLTGEVNRLARKVAEALHCFAVLYEIEHAESVDGKHADVALGLIVEHCGKVGGHCGNVRIAVDDKGAYKIGCRIGVDLGVEVGFTRFYAGNEGSGAPTRSAVENGDAKLCVVLFAQETRPTQAASMTAASRSAAAERVFFMVL